MWRRARKRPEVELDSRLTQANERTLLAWVRTGLTLMAFGFVLDRISLLLGAERLVGSESAFALVIGMVAITLGAMCQVIGVIRFTATRRAQIQGRSPIPPAGGPVSIAVAVALIGVALILYILSH